ncbi:MAG: FHA domain-containing protein, partial [Lachnospiraceae bacterium]|nr:FHA domain-containing protein [Lachnospiraceae bacterium]
MTRKYILYLYSAIAFHQIVLPALDNADYSVRLPSVQFGFYEDAQLNFEVISNIWYLIRENERHILNGNELLKLAMAEGEILSVIVQVTSTAFCVSPKYLLPRDRTITIGSVMKNNICYNMHQLVSAVHAVIFFEQGVYWLTDKSKNGIYINGSRVVETGRLNFGDCVDLFGLRMIILRDAVAILGDRKGSLRLRLPPYLLQAPYPLPSPHPFPSSYLLQTPYPPQQSDPLRPVPTAPFDKGTTKSGLTGYFHRSPRKCRSFNSDGIDEIEIEGPPAQRDIERPSFLMTIGPVLTMALPMILTTILSARQYADDNGYWYAGILMTGMTAFLGVFWAVINRVVQKKEELWAERHRREGYDRYLRDIEQYIEQKYCREQEILHERYPGWETAVLWEDIKRWLWNRNPEQADFLKQRVGLGEAPFSVDIKVPRLSKVGRYDELGQEPERIKKTYCRLKQIPVCIDLLQHRMIGIVGGAGKQGAVNIVAGLLRQIAINNCYTDVKLAFFYREEDQAMERLVRIIKWLPHIWAENAGIRYLAGNRLEASTVLAALDRIWQNPKRQHFILFIENELLLEGEGFRRYIYGQSGGQLPVKAADEWMTTGGAKMTSIFMGEEIGDMPNECHFFIQNDQDFAGLTGDGEEAVVAFDTVSLPVIERLCRRLAPVR